MKFSLSLILELLTRLLDLWERRQNKKREERIKDAYQKDADDPDAWFDSEFSDGVPGTPSAENPSKTSPASKTNPNSE